MSLFNGASYENLNYSKKNYPRVYVRINLLSKASFCLYTCERKMKFTYKNGIYANVTHVKYMHPKILDVF